MLVTFSTFGLSFSPYFPRLRHHRPIIPPSPSPRRHGGVAIARLLSLPSASDPLRMPSATFNTLSPSIPLHKSPRSRKLPTFGFSYNLIRLSATSGRPDRSPSDAVSGLSLSSLPRRSWSLSLSSSSSSSSVLGQRQWSGVHNFSSDRESDRFEVKATPAAEVSGEGEQSGSLFRTLELGLLFGLWYIFNIYFNIYNKQVRVMICLVFVQGMIFAFFFHFCVVLWQYCFLLSSN